MKRYLRKTRSFFRLLFISVDKFITKIRSTIRAYFMPLIIRKRVKNGVLALDIRNNNGLGSKLTWVLLLLAYCEERNLRLSVRFSYPKIHQDFFHRFFQLKGKHASENNINNLKHTVINSIIEVGPGAGDDRKITLEMAYKLVNHYIDVLPSILEVVKSYALEYMNTTKILGLHYRGTDKVGEAEIIEYQRVHDNIQLYIKKYGIPDKLFVATDTQDFLSYILSAELPFPVVYRVTDIRSLNNKAVHFGIDTFEKAILINEEALVNCLLLSKCSFLLKSSSFLSDWSKLFNPKLGVTVLNKPFGWAMWFPGSALIENNAFEPL